MLLKQYRGLKNEKNRIKMLLLWWWSEKNMTCRITKKETVSEVTIEKHSNSFGIEYYTITYKGISKMYSIYSKLDFLFEDLQEIDNDILYKGDKQK